MADPTAMFSVQDFLEAIGEQLDRAQDGLAIKARAGRPLTWALKDLSIDLKVFVEMNPRGEVAMRTAGPNEEGASTMHLSMTTITRPMVEENTWAFEQDSDSRPLSKLDGARSLDPEQQRKLSRMGVRTVGQLKQLASTTPSGQLEVLAGIPALNLRSMLEAAARPAVLGAEAIRGEGGQPHVRVHGVNLSDGTNPEVRFAGEPVEVLSASHNELLVRPLEHHVEGQIEVFVGPERTTGFFRLPGRTRAGLGNAPAQEQAATQESSTGSDHSTLASSQDPYGGTVSAPADYLQPAAGRGVQHKAQTNGTPGPLNRSNGGTP